MIKLATFSDSQMDQSAGLCVRSAMAHGVDCYQKFSPDLMQDWHVVKDNPGVFIQPPDPRRAWSWWAFKPLVIQVAMNQSAENDVIIYSDAGVEFINNVNYIIDRMDQDIFLFGNMYEHAHWCKRDVIDAIWPAPPDPAGGSNLVPGWWRFGKQVQASVIFFRVSDYTRKFVKEWLDWCLFEGGRLVDDSPSRTPNHPEFQEHRHDQAILTTMAYREGIKLNWWPAIYNDGAFTYPRGDYPDLGIPPLFHHHRRRNADWIAAA